MVSHVGRKARSTSPANPTNLSPFTAGNDANSGFALTVSHSITAPPESIAARDGPILVLHDTTEFSWRRKRPEAVGFTTTVNNGRDKVGRDRLHTVCGLLIRAA